MNFDIDMLVLVEVEYGLVQENSFGFYDVDWGLIIVSWYDEELMVNGGMAGGFVLFILVFDVVGNVNVVLSEVFEVNFSVILVEAYSWDG